VGAAPFHCAAGPLMDALAGAIKDTVGVSASRSTTGGTSDGRFLATLCPQVVEFGPVNASIHKINEHVRIPDIDALKNIYRATLERLLP
jgi:succinyl-diaminopimelate desuccinylase